MGRWLAVPALCLAAALAGACATARKAAPAAPAATPAPAAQSPAPAPVAPPPAADAARTLTPELERQALAHIERMRTIRPGADARLAAQYNQLLGDAWRFFIDTPAVLPVLRRQLAREVSQALHSDFILLDLGYFLYVHGAPGDREIAKSALFTLDPRSEIVRYNHQELFQFTQAVAADRDRRILGFIDRVFLRGSISVHIPEPDFTLDPSAACAFLYGAYGSGAEAHLKAQLSERKLAQRAVEVLIWIGSPASNAEVKAAMATAGRDYEMFERWATFMMTTGGPRGRAIVLDVKPGSMGPQMRAYHRKIRDSVVAATFETLRRQLIGAGGELLTESELRRRLGAIGAGNAAVGRASAQAVLDSTLPRAELIEELTRARTRLFRGASRDAAAEIQRLNALINALRYRSK